VRGFWPKLLVVVAAVEAAVIAAPRVKARVFPQEQEPKIARGARLAAASGCFACHGAGGTGARPNPGAKSGEVPGFVGGTPMMYANDDAEIREYILDGAPKRLATQASHRAEVDAALLKMPAYRGRLSDAEVDALAAYVKAASGLSRPADDRAGKGYDLAVANNCFGCHGADGAGGTANPGSFKGTIPGFLGTDFHELVQSDDELRSWIRTGGIPRLQNNPAARHFTEGQALHMPAFERRLSPEEIDSLVALVHALRGTEPK
jgi:mono/diheme cytochrome c family protein